MTDNTNDQNDPTPLSRRDFLAGLGGVAASALLAGCALPTPVFGAQNKLEMAPPGAKVHHIGIYPPIGISRVGLSEQTFAAPEVPGCAPNPAGGFKANGELKRQVQRFFIFAFDKNGKIIKEVTHGGQSKISWQVHVANTKAAWFGFNNPFDLGDTAPGIPAQLRNESVIGETKRTSDLIIDPGEQSISGTGQKKSLDGTFWSTKEAVHLAELQTDQQGRLQVVPASGVSKSVIENNPIVDFTKNDAWFDDWCDGTVKATVEIDGKSFTAKPAWVACCGPNFAPEIPPFTSMYDTIYDGLLKKYETMPRRKQKLTRPKQLSFSKDIYPMFYRLGLMQWVSGAAATRQGWIDVGDFSSVDYIMQLADKANKAERDRVFNAFWSPDGKVKTKDKTEEQQRYGIPFMIGSGIDYDASPKHWYNMPDHQYWLLKQWHAGNYDNDFTGEPQPGPCNIDQIPLAERPEALTRAALEPLSGGNFHPGVELTWVLGHGALFDDAEPFRIKVGNRPSLYQDIGPLITVDKVFPPKDTPPTQASYPIGPQMPGDLTRWMGLPWQPDAFSCQNVNFANDFPTVVWWPALLPVDVMPEYAFDKLSCPTLTREVKLKFASLRVAWARGAAGIGYHANASYFDGLNRMVYLVDQMGVVVKKKTPVELTKGVNKLPEYMFVEVDRGSMDLEFHEEPNLGKCFDKQGA